MTKITSFNKPTLQALRSEIDAALEQVGKKYGIHLHAGGARFDANIATFKLDCSLLNESGVAETKEMIDLKANYPQMAGKEVTLGSGTKGTIVGYSRRAKKYPFIIETRKGLFKITHIQATCGI